MEDDLFAGAETELTLTKKNVETDLTWNDDESWEGLVEEKKEAPVKTKKVEKVKKVESKEPVVQKTAPKKAKEGMFRDLEKDMNELSVAEDLLGTQAIRIDLLKPKTQKDFEQFAEIISNKLTEFENEKKFFIPLLKDILSKTTENMRSAEIKELTLHCTSLANKRAEQEKIKVKSKGKSSVVVDREIDPFALDSVTSNESGTYNKDDDFM